MIKSTPDAKAYAVSFYLNRAFVLRQLNRLEDSIADGEEALKISKEVNGETEIITL